MNKRSLLFVSLVGFAFVCCQLLFGYNDFKACQKKVNKQQAITQHLLSSVENSGISIARWSDHSEGDPSKKENNQNQFAVCFGEYAILLTKHSDAQSTIFIEGKPWFCLEKTTALENVDVALYSQDKKKLDCSEAKQIFFPTSSDHFPVFVIEFRNNKSPIVFIGEYKNGKIINRDSPIYGTSLVFGKSGNEFLPLGIYDSRDESLVSLDLSLAQVVFFDQKKVPSNADKQFYVLSNDYMQIVVSQETGAIEEINLPFVSTNDKSIVHSIEVDKELATQVPEESQFPFVRAWNVHGEQEKQVIGGYYPLLRRGIVSGNRKILPHQQALNLVYGKDLDAPLVTGFKVVRFESGFLELESIDGQLRRSYLLLSDEPYAFEARVHLIDHSNHVNAWITSGIPEVEIMSNAFSPSIKYREIKKNKGNLDTAKLPKSKNPLSIQDKDNIQWIANSNGYFGIILTPLQETASSFASNYISGNIAPTRLSLIPPKNQVYPASKYPGYQVLLPLSNSTEQTFLVYAGPLAEPTLKALDKAQESKLGKNFNYLELLTLRGFFAFIAEPFAVLLFVIMKFFNYVTGSWGISIILLTVFLKIVLYPLNAWSIRSMRRMQKLSPYIQEVQQKYKKEPKRAQMEVMALYKANKVNPITGCVPLLIQLPFLIAMFDLLKTSFLLRGVSFVPGWIDNLTAPDILFSWSHAIPFIGKEFHLLPILLGLVMFVQQRLTTLKRTGPVTDQQRQQDAMGTMMAVLFTVMFYNFPSGLNIYWLSSMLLGIIQQWATNKFLDQKHLKNEVFIGKKK